MSYILDALKRADAQRERGAVPGLHARQVTTPALPAAPNARTRLWLAVAAAFVLGAVAAGLWVWQRPVGTVRLTAIQPTPVQPTVNAPLAQPLPTPTPTATAPSTIISAPARAPVAPALPAVKSLSPKPRPEQKAEPKPELKPVAKAGTPDANAASAPLPRAQASATAAAVPLLSELPEEIRRQIPPLTITGAVYSDNPAQRLLLVNNLVLTQGSLAAPEVSLEEIRVRSSVFSFRGTRFRLAH
jgi:general secretion pathway protein B